MSVRALWSAVVLQALADIDAEHYDSVLFGQAESFFQADGAWRESRQAIADCLNLHVDELTRVGRAAIAARHLRDGPPPLSQHPVALPVQPQRPAPPPQPKAAPVVTKPAPPLVKRPRGRPKRTTTNLHDKDWWIARFLAKQHAA